MPKSNKLSPLAAKIASAPQLHSNDNPLWRGPCGEGPLGGITQSMLVRFLSCRERFRLKYVLGLEPHDKWNHRLGYGNMWHVCEESLAGGSALQVGGEDHWQYALHKHAAEQVEKYPLQRDEITKWFNVCKVQFPEYVKYWAEHPDVKSRTPLMQEQVFDVPYALPSGRVVRLRGKFDSVDLIDGGIYLQENKSKGDIDPIQVERQLRFDLQTMMYLVALQSDKNPEFPPPIRTAGYPFCGVRYNVIRRPLSGGKGNIKPHAAKFTKYTTKLAETEEQFYERLRRDYIADDPAYWFFRVRAEVTARDIRVFRETCLDPLLETVCWWYDIVTKRDTSEEVHSDGLRIGYKKGLKAMNYRTPFGVYSALEENGATEYDAFLATSSEIGLRRTDKLFTELQ